MNNSSHFWLLDRLTALQRGTKQRIQLLADTLLLVASFTTVMALRLESLDFLHNAVVLGVMAGATCIALGVFAMLGLYSRVIRYISIEGARPILGGTFAASMFFVVAILAGAPIPRSTPASFLLFAFGAVCGIRLGVRLLVSRSQLRTKEPVLIYGAGEAGRQLLNALRQGRTHDPVAMIDDAPTLHGIRISGCRVHPAGDLPGLVARHKIRTVLLALPSASTARRKEILARLEPLPVHVQTVPGVADLIAGRAEVTQVGEVPIEDLLGRTPVAPDPTLLATDIRGRVVLVTGAAGSIGSELCRQILRQHPAALVLLEVSEVGLYGIDLELRELAHQAGIDTRIVPLLGSVADQQRVDSAIRGFHVQTIYHAAAYKHVPLVEENVVLGIRNNVFGTLVLARAARKAGVEVFVLISTDKAVRPTNVMGATKRIAELICQREAARAERTRFSMVRFGNVLGSSGSVVPRFRAQIAAGGPVTVTHPDVTRYFMTIPEAAQLVIQAGAMAKGGEVLVLDMGEPVRIVELAARLIRLSGLRPYLKDPSHSVAAIPETSGDIAITFSGLRPGEKLYEELLIGASALPTEHPLICAATEIAMGDADLETLLRRLAFACDSHDVEAVRALLQFAPLGYTPSGPIADLTWLEAPEAPIDAPADPTGLIAA